MLDSCSIIIRKPPGHEYVTLGARAAWAMLTSGGLAVKVVLIGDGVYSALAKDGYVKSLFDRFMEEDGEIYAVKEDLAERGLGNSSIPNGIELIGSSDISEIVLDADSVMTF